MLKDAWRYNYIQTQYSVHTNGNPTVQLKFHTFALKLFANGFIISGQCRVIWGQEWHGGGVWWQHGWDHGE